MIIIKFKMWLKNLPISPAVLGIALFIGGTATATESPNLMSSEVPLSSESASGDTSSVLEQIDQYSDRTWVDEPMGQVTNVAQLRDVLPTDWAYEALQALVERYGIISGYPDGTFRGNRSMTRYEFAAGLNAALSRLEQLLATGQAGQVTTQDLAQARRLRDEFALELSLVRARTDALTARIGDLERTQFSRTTQLEGEVVFGAVSLFTGNNSELERTTVFGHRSRLNLETSFTGNDLLLTRLQAEGLASPAAALTPEGNLSFTGEEASNDISVDALIYQFPLGERTQVSLIANAGAADDFVNTVNPFFDGDGATGALSRFGTRPSNYYLTEGTGLAVRHRLSDRIELGLGYLASDPANPAEGGGFFNGPYAALGQVLFQPTEQSLIGLAYVRSFNRDFDTGSNNANLFSRLGLPVERDSYSIQASFQLSPRFAIGGWAGYTTSRVLGVGNADIFNWAVTLAFPNLGNEGSLGGIIVGMQPRVTRQDASLAALGINDPDTSLHLEAFYQYQLTDNIIITPGVIWLTAPDHNRENPDIIQGVLRTTFTF